MFCSLPFSQSLVLQGSRGLAAASSTALAVADNIEKDANPAEQEQLSQQSHVAQASGRDGPLPRQNASGSRARSKNKMLRFQTCWLESNCCSDIAGAKKFILTHQSRTERTDAVALHSDAKRTHHLSQESSDLLQPNFPPAESGGFGTSVGGLWRGPLMSPSLTAEELEYYNTIRWFILGSLGSTPLPQADPAIAPQPSSAHPQNFTSIFFSPSNQLANTHVDRCGPAAPVASNVEPTHS